MLCWWAASACLACGEASSHRLGGSLDETSNLPLSVGSCRSNADLEPIEDMEDGNQAIIPSAGRSGSWFFFNDETGTQTPSSTQLFPMEPVLPPRGSSQRAVHTSGSGFVTWGAGVGFEFASTAPYDASAYAGIAFWARGLAGLEQSVRVNVTDRNTSQFGLVCDPDCQADVGPTLPNGVCDQQAGPCHDYFGADFGLELGADWRFFSYEWAELRPRNWSRKNLQRIDAAELYGIRIQADSTGPFDFWVDDVTFICP